MIRSGELILFSERLLSHYRSEFFNQHLATAQSIDDYLYLYRICGRLFADEALPLPLAAEPHAQEQLAKLRPGTTLSRLTLRDLARLRILLELCEGSDPAAAIARLYATAGIEEQRAFLFSLPYLREPTLWLDYALAACRSNSEPLFDAVALDSPYPFENFDDLSWSRMVLKAATLWRSPGRIYRLDERWSREVAASLAAFLEERSLAGREVSIEWLKYIEERS